MIYCISLFVIQSKVVWLSKWTNWGGAFWETDIFQSIILLFPFIPVKRSFWISSFNFKNIDTVWISCSVLARFDYPLYQTQQNRLWLCISLLYLANSYIIYPDEALICWLISISLAFSISLIFSRNAVRNVRFWFIQLYANYF